MGSSMIGWLGPSPHQGIALRLSCMTSWSVNVVVPENGSAEPLVDVGEVSEG
jgi:hypothetical protein